ncbi:tetratricopeptide repeat protein [Streptomyces sp. NBC_01304]|uniref:tetratricopeptide repeat protein n=1 Tax=Streptomyces sp. NBC_01304 TaxID=2903818 RepID=UPI002E0DF016|nr:hypothetical protein OG430_42810 [Streptomyces sp. NBC_01304]
MVTQRSNKALRELVNEAGMGEAQLAAAVRVVAAEHGQPLACGQSTVSRWLSGTRPRPPAPVFLLEALSRRLGRPVTGAEAGLSESDIPVSSPGLDLSWDADAVRTLATLAQADLDPARRRLLTASVYSLAALALPDAAGLPGRERPDGDEATVLPARVEQMEAMSHRFAQAAQAHGGGHVRATVAAYLTHPVTGWLNTPAPEPVHRQLLAQTARLTLLLGTITADDGADALAQHYHRCAARLAADAGDTAAYTIALRSMAAHASDLGHHTPAVWHLSQRAAEVARCAPAITRAYTLAHLATAAAHHDSRTALSVLAQAERLHEQADTTPGPFTAYPPAALHYQRAQTLTALGDLTGAISAYTLSLRLRTGAERQTRTLTHAALAETLLRLGHLDQALAHWSAFLDDYPHLGSARTARRLAAMRRNLAPHTRHRPTQDVLARAMQLR